MANLGLKQTRQERLVPQLPKKQIDSPSISLSKTTPPKVAYSKKSPELNQQNKKEITLPKKVTHQTPAVTLPTTRTPSASRDIFVGKGLGYSANKPQQINLPTLRIPSLSKPISLQNSKPNLQRAVPKLPESKLKTASVNIKLDKSNLKLPDRVNVRNKEVPNLNRENPKVPTVNKLNATETITKPKSRTIKSNQQTISSPTTKAVTPRAPKKEETRVKEKESLRSERNTVLTFSDL